MNVFRFSHFAFFISLIIGMLIPLSLWTDATTSVSAQGSPTGTPTPNPTITVLESTIAAQQINIEKLEREQGFEAKEREIGFRDINSQWKTVAAIGGIAILVLGWFGFTGVRDAKLAVEKQVKNIEAKWEAQLQSTLDKAVYKLDLSNLPIYLPSGENLENIHRLLQFRKFENVSFYKTLDEFERGVLIISLKGKDEKGQGEILGKFKDFIDSQHPSAANTGLIIYAPAGIKVPPEIMESHDNLVTANYPSTVVSSIFTVGRGIELPAPKI